MRNAAHSLLKHHGLKVSNLVLLGPQDAEPVRFARQVRRWNGRWSGGHPNAPSLPVFLASLSGLLLLAITAGWWVLDGDAPLGWLLAGLVVLTGGIGWLGMQLVRPWSEPLRTRRFETSVRRQLLQGAWALVVHEMPRHRQAGAMALLRGASLRWCAVVCGGGAGDAPLILPAQSKAGPATRWAPPSLMERSMAIYEQRTYTVIVGKMAEVVQLYQAEGWPALAQHPARLVGYFTGDIGALNQLVHLWKFDDDADRRTFWAALFADPAFMAFARKLRPLLASQENKLLLAAPWGPQP